MQNEFQQNNTSEKKQKKSGFKYKKELFALLLIVAVIFGVAKFTFIGEKIDEFMDYMFGWATWLVYILISYFSIITIIKKKSHKFVNKKLWGIGWVVLGMLLLFPGTLGKVGSLFDNWIEDLLPLWAIILIGAIILTFGISLLIFNKWNKLYKIIFNKIRGKDKKEDKGEKEIVNDDIQNFHKNSTHTNVVTANNAPIRSVFISDVFGDEDMVEADEFENIVPNDIPIEEECNNDEEIDIDTVQEDTEIVKSNSSANEVAYEMYDPTISPHGRIKKIIDSETRDDLNADNSVFAQFETNTKKDNEHESIFIESETDFISKELEELPFDMEDDDFFNDQKHGTEDSAGIIQTEKQGASFNDNKSDESIENSVSKIIAAEESLESYESTIESSEGTACENFDPTAPAKNYSCESNYEKPGLKLLDEPKTSGVNEKNIERAKILSVDLKTALANFGIKAEVENFTVGPAVTRFEIKPEIGTRVSKIVNLSDDIKMALAAKEIRIEAPIPGKSAVGIEVPNQETLMVSFKEVIKNIPEGKEDAKMLVALGKDLNGLPVFTELNKMPHLLVAGATGSGKSVCINTILTSLIMRSRPDEVRLLLVDPKMVELASYNGVPHLMAPVITDSKKASLALNQLVEEMEKRYMTFAKTGTRNLESYNCYAEDNNVDKLPYILCVIDELADLMMVASKDVEDSIQRITQKARAAGIHLIVATQRPSVNVVTGTIKANIPSRMAFAVSSQTDSRTILDTAGAEKLLGKGDMLFAPIGQNHPIRVQGAFLSEEEVWRVVKAVIKQGKAQYCDEFVNLKDNTNSSTNSDDSDFTDELYQDVKTFVVEKQRASTSLIQRRFGIGYNRASRIIDELENNSVIGPVNGSKPRDVLIKK